MNGLSHCPECGEKLTMPVSYYRCACGWRFKKTDNQEKSMNRYSCSYPMSGQPCSLPGTVSNTIYGGKWFCSYHFRMMKGIKS